METIIYFSLLIPLLILILWRIFKNNKSSNPKLNLNLNNLKYFFKKYFFKNEELNKYIINKHINEDTILKQYIINSHIANIIDGPTLLFKGSNGIPTFGVTVEAIHKEKGYRDTWALNDYTLKQPMSQYALGLSNIQYKQLLLKIDKLHQDYTIDQITK